MDRVLLGMSGGVDSSAAAIMLMEQKMKRGKASVVEMIAY